MDKNDILKYYDYLCRLSSSKCDSQESADDMVSETILAALAYISGGGSIEYPKTWLANTLMHKINNELRRKYHMPVIMQLDSASDVASDNSYEDVYLKSDEAAVYEAYERKLHLHDVDYCCPPVVLVYTPSL